MAMKWRSAMRRIDDEDDDDMVRDGDTVRTPLYLVDAVRFEDGQPHFLRAVDEASKSKTVLDLDAARDAARAARESWIKQMCDAWKRPPTRDASQPDLGTRAEEMMRRHLRTEPDYDAQARRDAAWAQYRDQLGNAWKIDPRAATAIERQGERWRGG